MIHHPLSVAAVGEADYEWHYHSSECVLPIPRSRSVVLDPFPGYRHDPRLVEDVAEQVITVWPPGSPVTYWCPDREPAGRSNAFADRAWNYDSAPPTWSAEIVLAGKRTPLHPAVTRFLVAHEYGHQVEWWIEDMRNLEDGDVRRDYAAMRGLGDHWAHGGRWHDAAGEVLADDFRLLVCGIEMEHWPHPDIYRPTAEVGDWWTQALDDWRDHTEQAA